MDKNIIWHLYGQNRMAKSPPKAIGGAAALVDFCNFSTKITHFYAYFGQNIYFKAITHQLKAFEKQFKVLNGINEVEFL